MGRSEGNMSLKNRVTPQGIDPGTVRLFAQRLNHYAAPGPNRPIEYNILGSAELVYVKKYNSISKVFPCTAIKFADTSVLSN